MLNSSKSRSTIFWILAGIALVVGIIHTTRLAYVNDDSFISFRSAKNLVNGLGLVFNAGERVEAFTNFLWTILIAVGMKFNLDPVPFSMGMGIVFYCLTLLLFAYVSWKYRITEKPSLFVLPLTSLALCLHRDFNVYATGGLETSMYTFFVSLGFVLLLFAKGKNKLLAPGFVFVLAMMTRPDGVIFLAASLLFILLTQKNALERCWYFLAPSLFIFLPYWITRYEYYGYFFPNSFYAKSADLAYFSQGFEYARMYFTTYYGFSLLVILALVYAWQKRTTIFSSPMMQSLRNKLYTEDHPSTILLLGTLFIIMYSFFILRVGGDFMFARFFIPITPIMFFMIEFMMRRVSTTIPALILSALLLSATYFRCDLYGEASTVGYIADEPQFYPAKHLQSAQETGAMLKKYFRGTQVRVAFWGGQVRLMYYAEPYYALESMAGLTDPELAHALLTERGRPGHEKRVSNEMLIKKRVQLFFGNLRLPEGGIALNQIIFNNILARIITYDNSIMAALEKYPEVRFINTPRFLDDYISHLNESPVGQVAEDYKFFKTFYFDHNRDPQRQNAFESYLRSHPVTGNYPGKN